jgi:rhodanese-related sulfurtransferase
MRMQAEPRKIEGDKEMPAVDTPELEAFFERDEDFLLINTLPRENFEKTKLPRAVNIPQDQPDFVQQVEKRAGAKDKKIVVYCANIDCDSSTQAAKKLDDAGFTNVYDYRGGAKAWQDNAVDQTSRAAG